MVTGTDILVRTQPRIADIPRRVLALSVLIGILAVISCGGGGAQNSNSGPVTYTIGGTISGLSGSGLVLHLQDNGGSLLSVGAGATSFTFATAVASGSGYSVTVFTQLSQPSNPSQTCSVSSGSGTVGSADVTSVQLTCINSYTIGGTILDLSGSGLVLQNDGYNLSVGAGATGFTFLPIASGSAYSVTVLSQPTNPTQTCTVTSGSGTVTSVNVTSVAISCISGGGSVLTGSMTTVLYGQTATLLNNGQVLIAGGAYDTADDPLASAELYDPATGTFTATGNMTDSRIGHTATLLNNGQVLIAGGYDGNDGNFDMVSADLYNPATGTFTSTGNMTVERIGYTATLLNNGQVLLAGGDDGGSVDLASAELYDPATGTFTATGSMTSIRYGQTATLLNNGQVLIAGGVAGVGALASAELYDPATGTFTSTGNMTAERVGDTATLLNNGQVLVAGGFGVIGNTDSADLYNPATGTFTSTGYMTTERIGYTATLLNNGQVLIAGGADDSTGSEIPLAGAEVYDPATGTFTATGSMTNARQGQTATLLNNGNVLVAGGESQTTVLASAELYSPATLTPTGLVSITVTPADPTLSVGSTKQFVATGTFSDGSMQNLQSVTWSSSNQAAGTITNDAGDHGVALALTAGNSTITASAGSVSGSTLLIVQ